MTSESQYIRISLEETLDSLLKTIKETQINRDKVILTYGQCSSLFVLAKFTKVLTPEVEKTVTDIMNLTAKLCGFKPIW